MYENELAQLQKTFDATPVDGDAKPNKTYRPPFIVGGKDAAIITNAQVGHAPWSETHNDTRIFLIFELTHEPTDRSETMFIPLQDLSERATKWVKDQIRNAGFDVDNIPLSELERHIDTFIGRKVEIFTKYDTAGKKPRYKFYINKVLSEPSDDDIPF